MGKHQAAYLSIARKFITFSNSICILYIQEGLKQEAYELLKKCSFLELELYEKDPQRCMKWKGHLLYNYILWNFFGKSSFTSHNLKYVMTLAKNLDDSKIKNWDFLWAIHFYAFYIYWKGKKYEDCIDPLETAQKYIWRLLESELPNDKTVIEKVQEVDEDAEKSTKELKILNSDGKRKTKSKFPNQVISYYDTSDSDEFDQENDRRGAISTPQTTQNDPKNSRLWQLSKFNLFGLIKLWNASLVLVIQKDKQEALRILNESIETLTILGEKFESPIIAQNLLELLVDQIYSSQECKDYEIIILGDDGTIKKVLLSRGSRNFRSVKEIIPSTSPTPTPDPEPKVENSKDKNYIFASSDLPFTGPEKDKNEEVGPEEEEEPIPTVIKPELNPRAVINSEDFKTIMNTATFIPFIKPGIPRFQIKPKEANPNKGNMKRREKFFLDNILMRENILNYYLKETEKGERTEGMNIVNNINSHTIQQESDSQDIEEGEKSADKSFNLTREYRVKQTFTAGNNQKDNLGFTNSGNPYNTRHPRPKKLLRNKKYRSHNNKSQVQYKR